MARSNNEVFPRTALLVLGEQLYVWTVEKGVYLPAGVRILVWLHKIMPPYHGDPNPAPWVYHCVTADGKLWKFQSATPPTTFGVLNPFDDSPSQR